MSASRSSCPGVLRRPSDGPRERAGVADGAFHHAGRGVGVGADDAGNFQRGAHIVRAEQIVHARVRDAQIGVAAGLGVVAVVLPRQDQLERSAAQLVKAPAVLCLVNAVALHGRAHGVFHLFRALQAHGVHDKVADLIVFVDDEHDLVIVLWPCAVEHVVLLLHERADKRAVFAGEHFFPDLHG